MDSGTIVLAITAIVLAITAIAIFWYSWETHKMRRAMVESNKQTKDANLFAVLAAVQSQLRDPESYNRRRFLLQDFPIQLAEVVRKELGNPDVLNESRRAVVVRKVLKVIQENPEQLWNFNMQLHERTDRHGAIHTLDAVELAVLDFDVLALPVQKRIASAREAAKAYKSLLGDTAKAILPFVAIQRQLRGDPHYREEYIHLLKELEIDTQGL